MALAWSGFGPLACGGFENAALRGHANELAGDAEDVTPRDDPLDTDTNGPAHPRAEPRPLTVRAQAVILARVGEVLTFPLGLDAQPEGLVSWSVIEGALPSGLRLDALNGQLSGRPTLGSEGSYILRVGAAPVGGATCWEAGRSEPFELRVQASCETAEEACVAPASCQGGACVLADAPCSSAAPDRLRFISQDKLRGLYSFRHARVVTNTRLLDVATGMRQGLLQFSEGNSTTLRSLSYRLPGDLLLPLRADQTIDVGLYLDASGSAGLAFSDVNEGFLFFGYDGALTGEAFTAVCKALGSCPLQSLRNALTACPPNIELSGDVYVATSLLLQAQGHSTQVQQGDAIPMWSTAPGEGDGGPGAPIVFAPMVRQSLSPEGEPPQGPWQWHSFMVQASTACPTATIDLSVSTDEASTGGLLPPLARLILDGRRSRSLAGHVNEWSWELEKPAQSDAQLLPVDGEELSHVALDIRLPGVYSISLEVTDDQGQVSCGRDWAVYALEE